MGGVNTQSSDDNIALALVSRCPWPAESRDSTSLFGTRLAFVPWGWEVAADGSFTDNITSATSTEQALIAPLEENFAFKAFGARLCVQELDAFTETWLTLATGDSRSELAAALDRLRSAALALTACQVIGDEEHRSKLDTALAASRVIAKYSESQRPPEYHDLDEIESLSKSTWHLLRMIKGFCVLLQGFNTVDVSPASFPDFMRGWKSENLDVQSMAVDRYYSGSRIGDYINSLKETASVKSMSDAAYRLARNYMSAVNGAQRKLDELSLQTPWSCSIVAVKWNKPLPHVSRLSSIFRYRGMDRYRILVTASSQLVPSQNGKPAESIGSVKHNGPLFYFAYEDQLQLYPESKLQIQLQYIDDGAWRSGPTTRPFDSEFVFGGDPRKRIPGTRRFETEPSRHVIELDMPVSYISKEYERLDRCHWTKLLTLGPLRDSDNPHKLLFQMPGNQAQGFTQTAAPQK